MIPTEWLKSVGIDITKKGHNTYKLKATGFMDLTVETWQDGTRQYVSMCHYGEANGDLMKDPDIMFQVTPKRIIYHEMQNDYVPMYSTNHFEIQDFMENTWLSNLIAQGHKLEDSD